MSIGQTSPDKSMGVSGVFSSVLQPFDCNLNEPGEFMRILISTRLLIADFALRIAASPAKVCLELVSGPVSRVVVFSRLKLAFSRYWEGLVIRF